MSEANDKHEEEYRQHFRGVRPILEKHFSTIQEDRIPGVVHLFINEKEYGLYENWNFDQQQKYLTLLRAQLRKASGSLSKIHPRVLDQVTLNLTLPLEVLNGTYDRKTCAEEVFDLDLSQTEIDAATQALTALNCYIENIDKAIKYTQDELPIGIPVGIRNIDAWRVVEAAVEVSRRYPEAMNVPRKMNGSGPLRRLLVDLFEYYNIHANVDAVFNGWSTHIDRKREFLDLLPID